MKVFYESTALLGAALLVLFINQTNVSKYIEPILGLFIVFSVIYIIYQRRKKSQDLLSGSPLEIFAVTSSLLLIIFATGGISSSLFFILYLLIIGIGLIFEAQTVFVLLAGLLLVFFPHLSGNELSDNLIKLGSLILVSPIAYFFGNEFSKRRELESEIRDKAGQIIEDTEVLKRNKPTEEQMDEIENIEEQAKELKKDVEQ